MRKTEAFKNKLNSKTENILLELVVEWEILIN